jgi:hypothetical protein
MSSPTTVDSFFSRNLCYFTANRVKCQQMNAINGEIVHMMLPEAAEQTTVTRGGITIVFIHTHCLESW